MRAAQALPGVYFLYLIIVITYNPRMSTFEFSFATQNFSPPLRWTIRMLEMVSGKAEFEKLYEEFLRKGDYRQTLWNFMLQKLDIKIDYNEEALKSIPRTGSLIVVANHPYGLIDGGIVLDLVGRARPDTKIMINAVARNLKALKDVSLPVSFDGNEQARLINRDTIRKTFNHLEQGGTVVMFPAGAMATTEHWYEKKAKDVPWGLTAAKLALKTGAPVVPIYFEGQNSRLFQIVSSFAGTEHLSNPEKINGLRQLSCMVRLGLIFREALRLKGQTVHARIGAPVYVPGNNEKQVTEFLRAQVYGLEAGL
jgi:putative hemolysin